MKQFRRWFPALAPLVFLILGYVFLTQADRRFSDRVREDNAELAKNLVQHGMTAEQADDLRQFGFAVAHSVSSFVASAANMVLFFAVMMSVVAMSRKPAEPNP